MNGRWRGRERGVDGECLEGENDTGGSKGVRQIERRRERKGETYGGRD